MSLMEQAVDVGVVVVRWVVMCNVVSVCSPFAVRVALTNHSRVGFDCMQVNCLCEEQ